MPLLWVVASLALGMLAFVVVSLVHRRSSPVRLLHTPGSPVATLLPRLATLHVPYRPTPYLASSSLVHSLASLLKANPPLHYRRETVLPRSQQAMLIDWLEAGVVRPDAPIVIVVPGVTGHSYTPYLTHLVHAFNQSGCRVAVLSHPGLHGEPLKSARFLVTYEHADLEDRIAHIHSCFPEAPLHALAYSLGACLLLNYLGKCGKNTPLSSAVSISNPFNINSAVKYIRSYFLGRHMIDRHFAWVYRDIFVKNEELIKAVHPHVDSGQIRRISSVTEFDTYFSTAAYGFASLEEYYEVSSCVQSIPAIAVPLLVLHADDDPVVPKDALPLDALRANPNILTAITDHGGHSSWLEGTYPFTRPAWVDRVAVEWLHAVAKLPAQKS